MSYFFAVSFPYRVPQLEDPNFLKHFEDITDSVINRMFHPNKSGTKTYIYKWEINRKSFCGQKTYELKLIKDTIISLYPHIHYISFLLHFYRGLIVEETININSVTELTLDDVESALENIQEDIRYNIINTSI